MGLSWLVLVLAFGFAVFYILWLATIKLSPNLTNQQRSLVILGVVICFCFLWLLSTMPAAASSGRWPEYEYCFTRASTGETLKCFTVPPPVGRWADTYVFRFHR